LKVKTKQVARTNLALFTMDQDNSELEERLFTAMAKTNNLKNVAAIFVGTYEIHLVVTYLFVVNPEEFFHTAKELETETETLKKLQRDFHTQQEDLFLKFYRANMSAFGSRVIAKTIARLQGVDMDKALIDELLKALEDPGNRFHEEEPVE
jgi:uncharacterized protein YktB (UPF0637 family)